MKCKDIPDTPILEFLRGLGVRPATWFWSADYKPDNSVLLAMPHGTCTKLARAKMRTLIHRGLVDGCTCGCRGDYFITAKGEKLLLTPNAGVKGPRPDAP